MMDHLAPRLYQLQSHPFYGFHTGKRASGQQVLIGLSYNTILSILFTEQGRVEEIREHQFLKTQRVPLDLTPHEREEFQEHLQRQMRALGCIEQPIAVQRFFVQSTIGIEPFPSYCLDFLEHESTFPEEEQKWYRELIQQWQQDENFVFYWGNDYYCNKAGKVTSS